MAKAKTIREKKICTKPTATHESWNGNSVRQSSTVPVDDYNTFTCEFPSHNIFLTSSRTPCSSSSLPVLTNTPNKVSIRCVVLSDKTRNE